jgi:hypothetical protein
MSLFRILGPSIAALGFAATVLGTGLSCALAPAWATTESCVKEIKAVIESANHGPNGRRKDRALRFLAEAKDVLANEGDEQDCMTQLDRAGRVLGL